MRRPIQTIALACSVAVLAAAGAIVPPAIAAAGNAVINDCESNGQLTHPYTHQELVHALAVMPATVKQYTNCYDVIQQALVKGQDRTGTAGSSSSSSFLPTPVIVILVLLILAAITFAAIAIRRRAASRADDQPGADAPPGEDDQPAADAPPGEDDQPAADAPPPGDDQPGADAPPPGDDQPGPGRG